MKRLITKQLNEWKNKENRKPLIIRGARQVGKTYSISAFANQNFNSFIKIDFEKQIQLKKIFEGDLSVKKIIELIELETDCDITPTTTLLFFDEVQLCPRALTALRYFLEDLPELHVIACGSLLEFEMEKISFPVGRVEFMFMYPMNFEEFLINTGQDRLNKQRPRLFSTQPVTDLVHDKLIEQLKRYFIIGGMPESVKTFCKNKSLRDVAAIHENLFFSLIQDLSKYEKRLDNELIREILETIPENIGSTVKYTRLNIGSTIYKIKQVLYVLEKSLLVTKIRSSIATGLPLGANVSNHLFKICFLDIGLMQFISGIKPLDVIQTNDILGLYKGRLCEQFIGQELIAAGGSQNRQLFYWSRAKKSSNAEIDYLIVRNGTITPLEIKHGPAGRLKSLHLFMETHQQIKQGIVLNSGNIGQIGNIIFMPLYTKIQL